MFSHNQVDSILEPFSGIRLRQPTATDGPAVHRLIESCPPLDRNSLYANLIQCTHFAETCALADAGGEVVGWVGGHVVPRSPDAFFVWQVAVHEQARGRGLAEALVLDVLFRPACAAVRHVHATVTDDNASSWRMFRSLADTLGTALVREPFFDRDTHLGGTHATEHLLRIGPFDPPAPPNVEAR